MPTTLYEVPGQAPAVPLNLAPQSAATLKEQKENVAEMALGEDLEATYAPHGEECYTHRPPAGNYLESNGT